jgi:trimeric autotransporter adhesin
MGMKGHLKRTVLAITLAAFVWTGTAWSVSTVSAAANPFSDVKAGHWAEKHVVKLALQNIILGSEGKFRPNDSIKREDAVIVALKFMGAADQIASTGNIAFPGTFQVDDYAKPYVVEAFKRKLLLTDEEYALANQEKGKPWGKTPASREWVARLLVRAIAKESEAAANGGKATAFSDNGKMDAKLRAYVLTAVQEGLVAGVTPTTFEPKSPITRAAIATLFSKAETKIATAYSGQVSGMLLSISAGKLSVLHDDGTIHDYTMTPSTMIGRYDSDKPGTLASLKLYGKAILISGGDGSIGYVEQVDDTAKVKSVDGTLSRIHTEAPKLTLLVGDNLVPYTYDTAHPPVVMDAQGKTIALQDIPVGAAISLKLDTVRKEPQILAVTVKQSVINKTGSGTVTAWNAAAGTLDVSDAAGTKETWSVSPQATFKRGDVYVLKDDLKVGDTITYEVVASVVKSIQMAKPVQTTAIGKFDVYNQANNSIQFIDNGELKAKFLADKATVTIDGLKDAGFTDLQKDDAVTLALDANGNVTNIHVTNRSVQTVAGVTVAGYIAKTNSLSVFDAAAKPYNFYLRDNVRYDSNGTKLDAAAAQLLLTTGKKITVSYSGSNDSGRIAVSVSFIGSYTGTLLENNTTAKTLKLQVDATNTVTLPYASPSFEGYGQTSSSFSDVKVGDPVTVVLNAAQDLIVGVQLHKTAQFEVVSVDVSGSKFRAKLTGGNSAVEEWTIPSTAVLQDETGAAVTLGQFAPSSVVNVSFQGKTPVKIKSVNITYGKVVSVNTTASTVDIALANGSTVTRLIGLSPLIVRDNTTSASLSAVQPDDRVEIRKDENDRSVLQVVPAVRKDFWYYDPTARTVNVWHSGTEQYSYEVDPQVYIHQGSTLLTMSSLNNHDAISLYVLRGKVIEIAK